MDDPLRCFGVRVKLKVALSIKEGMDIIFLMEFIATFALS